ncbi:MAG: glycosyltransferase family 1 protein [Bacteroidota bacterium]
MRIGFDAKRLFLNNRGLGNYARNLLYGLVKYHSDNEYFLFTPRVSNEYVSPGLSNSDNVHVRAPSGIMSLSGAYWRSGRLGNQMKKESMDVFHGLSQELPLDIRKAGAKSIVTIHDMIFLKHPEFYNPIDRWIYFKKVKFAVENADTILAISNQTKNDLVNTFKLKEERIKVVYQSCNEVFYDKRTERELEEVKRKWALPDQFILYVGALNENKNVLIILKALNQLKGKLGIPLVIVGSGIEYKEKLIEYAASNNLSHQLIFAHDLASPSPLELSSFYQLASVFIFPSFYEGFGIPVLESRFSGTPVIASKGSGLDEAGGTSTLYFDPTEEEELAELIEQVIKGEEISDNNVDTFHIENSVTQLMEIYNQL